MEEHDRWKEADEGWKWSCKMGMLEQTKLNSCNYFINRSSVKNLNVNKFHTGETIWLLVAIAWIYFSTFIGNGPRFISWLATPLCSTHTYQSSVLEWVWGTASPSISVGLLHKGISLPLDFIEWRPSTSSQLMKLKIFLISVYSRKESSS